MKMKHENWSNGDEIILAEGMLRQLREGTPVKEMLKYLSVKLDRTPKSIENRWYQFVQPRYKNIIEKIKLEKNEDYIETPSDDSIEKGLDSNPLDLQSTEMNSGEINHEETIIKDGSININDVILFLQKNKNIFNELEKFKRENERLELENQQLKEQNKQVTEDFKVYAKILNEARSIFKNDTKKQTYNIDNTGHVVIGK